MYQCQLNVAMLCATIALGISWQLFSYPTLLVCSLYQFHAYFHVRIILYHLGITLLHEDGFSKVKSSYIKRAYYSICDDYGVNENEMWMHGDWFYPIKYSDLGPEEKSYT